MKTRGMLYGAALSSKDGMVFLKFSEEPSILTDFLKRSGDYIRNFSTKPLKAGCVEVSWGSPLGDVGLFGVFVPEGADKDAVLVDLKSRYGPATELRDKPLIKEYFAAKTIEPE